MTLSQFSLLSFGGFIEDTLKEVAPLPSQASSNFAGVKRSFIRAACLIMRPKDLAYFVTSSVTRSEIKDEIQLILVQFPYHLSIVLRY